MTNKQDDINKNPSSPEKLLKDASFRQFFTKLILWAFGSLLTLFIIILLFISYNKWIQHKIVESVSNSIENVDFKIEEFEINFFTNKVFLKNIHIEYADEDVDGIDEIPEISIEGINWYYWFMNDSLKIRRFAIHNESIHHHIHTLLSKKGEKKEKINSISKNLKFPIFIEKTEFITEYLHLQNDSINHCIDQNTISLYNIGLDSTHLEVAVPTVSFHLHNYSLIRNKDTLFSAKNIHFEGKDSTLIIQGILYLQSSEKDVFIKEITLGNIGVSQYLKDRVLNMEEFLIKEAYIDLHEISTSNQNFSELNIKKQVPELLEPFCHELKIHHFNIKKSDVSFQNLRGTGSKKINNITISLKHIHIHKNAYLDKNKILFADSIGLGFEDFVTNNEHYSLSFLLGNINMNSNDTILYFYDFHYKKTDQLSCFIPQFSIKNIDWKTIWQKQTLHIQSILLQSPEIAITASTENKLRDTPQSLNEIVAKMGKAVKLDNIQIRNATLLYKNKHKTRPLQFAKIQRLNVNLKDIQILAESAKKINIEDLFRQIRIFKCKNIYINLANQSHLAIKELFLSDTHTDFIVKNIKYTKDSTARTYLGLLNISGINWDQYWENKHFSLDKITLHSPTISLVKNIESKRKSKIKEKLKNTGENWKELLPTLIKTFAKSLKINEVHLDRGYIEYKVFENRKKVSYQKLKQLHVHAFEVNIPQYVTDSLHSKPLYSNNIYIKGKNYVFNDENQEIQLDSFLLNTNKKDITFHEFEFNSENNLDLCIPKIRLTNINWKKYWNKSDLFIGNFTIQKPQISWITKKDSINSKLYKKDISIPKIKDITKDIANKLSPNLKNIHLRDFSLDKGGITIKDGNHIHYCENIQVNLKDVKLDNNQFNIGKQDFVIEQYSLQTASLQNNILKIQYHSRDSTLRAYAWTGESIDKGTSLSSHKIELVNIHVKKLINSQQLYAKRFQVNDPKIILNLNAIGEKEKIKTNKEISFKDLHKKVGFEELVIKHVFTDLTTTNNTHYTGRGDLYIDSFEIDTTWAFYNSFDNIRMNGGQFSRRHPKNLYNFSIEKIDLDYNESFLSLKNLQYFPKVSYKSFFETIEDKCSVYSIKIPKITTNNLDFYHFLHDKSVFIKKLYLKDCNFEMFNDKRILKNAGYRARMPHEALQKIKTKFKIDSLFIQNGTIVYKEQVMNSDSVGAISFHKTNLAIANIHNDHSNLLKNEMIIRGQSLFMNEGLLKMNSLQINLFTNKLEAKYKATLSNMNVLALNRILTPNSNLSINDGFIKLIEVEGIMLDNHNKGNIHSRYQNIQILYQNKSKKGSENKVLSMLGNMILNSNQTKRQKEKFYYKKDPKDSFVKFLWLGIKDGIERSLLPPYIEWFQDRKKKKKS